MRTRRRRRRGSPAARPSLLHAREGGPLPLAVDALLRTGRAGEPVECLQQGADARRVARRQPRARVADDGARAPVAVARGAREDEVLVAPVPAAGARKQVIGGPVAGPRLAAAPHAARTIPGHDVVDAAHAPPR